MTVLVIGASRGIGRDTVRATLKAGHRVRAFARSADSLPIRHPNLERWRGDALNPDDVAAALVGVQTVIQTLGVSARALMEPVTLFSEATRVLLPAMEHQGVRRLITVTGFGAGDCRSAISCPQRVPFRLLLGRAYDDKSVQEELIKASALDWTIVRPGILVGGPGFGRYAVLTEPHEWRNGVIARRDVARFLVRQITDTTHIHKAPVLVWG
ncbi:SDR family NAD(P)-dependent oxidoreductase [Roseospira marina]|uniref:SDR family NAD(P)-dependent oxidoreductase n=1 Tax=Roseospira marina TaxID=140057 RepID=A0A5M6IE35_9PROT|nr:NAD(P)H-binding protein [Roseospira marina]KAA5606227.1 SDR family NAD(P)-dependent oxidoreductase [Roseospira marina]MBB4314379.1 uncharacterized protein YbjT (DUF2867 family) [Roseospira marina]MBB5087539.1 uncharacterized protein YbjT (DUF2867 family) [Roseospira marina]